MSIEKVEIDTKDVAAKLSFLIGKTILMRTAEGDASVAARVEAVMAENTPGTEGHPVVSLYTTIGVKRIANSSQFDDILVLESDNSFLRLRLHTDMEGIVF
jgi:hypothetical protein